MSQALNAKTEMRRMPKKLKNVKFCEVAHRASARQPEKLPFFTVILWGGADR